MDTIVAQATALVAQPIGIVRLSGPKSLEIAKKIANIASLEPRYAKFVKFLDENRVIDQGIVIYFRAPHSFTGDDVVEMQVHGSAYVVSELISLCVRLGARMAEPGEFSKRAFLNGKMSLDQVEAVADLIVSTSEKAARSAVLSLEGGLQKEVLSLQQALMNLRVLLEAEIDFSEEDIPTITEKRVGADLNKIKMKLEKLLSMCSRGVVMQKGINIALVGAPNVGKSTLMNAICQQDVSIVTQEAGTTRDVIGKDVVYKGVALHFLDTAGIRETASLAEKAGIDRSYKVVENADLVLHIQDITQSNQHVFKATSPIWKVFNKCDLRQEEVDGFSISAKEQVGIEDLLDAILEHFLLGDQSETPFSARDRHIDVLKRAIDALPEENLPYEMMASELRTVQTILSEITGEVSNDDLLGVLFSDFCIGK